MNIFSRLLNDSIEIGNGRINVYGALWVHDTKITKRIIEKQKAKDERRFNLLARNDADGNRMFLVTQKGIHCTNPECLKFAPQGHTYPHHNEHGKESWSIPFFVCQHECRHYRAGEYRGRHKMRYPHCEWLKEKRGGPLGVLTGTLKSASDTMSDIMGTPVQIGIGNSGITLGTGKALSMDRHSTGREKTM